MTMTMTMTMIMTRVARVGLANPSYGAVRLKLWPQRSNLRTTFDRDSIMRIMMIMTGNHILHPTFFEVYQAL